MKTLISLCLLTASVTSTAFADVRFTDELSPRASKMICNLLRAAEHKGNKEIEFEGSAQLSSYRVDNLTCYFQNSDSSIYASIKSQLSESASKVVGNLLRDSNLKGDQRVTFSGGPNVTEYSVGNVSCYFQNSDDSVSCSVTDLD